MPQVKKIVKNANYQILKREINKALPGYYFVSWKSDGSYNPKKRIVMPIEVINIAEDTSLHNQWLIKGNYFRTIGSRIYERAERFSEHYLECSLYKINVS